MEATKLIEQPTVLRNHFEQNFISQLETTRHQAVKDVQLLYNKRLFDFFENKDEIFHEK